MPSLCRRDRIERTITVTQHRMKVRIANGSWATRERLGNGQVILFATQPNFRGFFRGSERLLLNALFYGPGLGANASVDW